MPPTPQISRQTVSAQVVVRFLLRLTILALFATLGAAGFGRTLESLMVLSVCYCLVIGGLRRESPLGPVLTHYDEAAAYIVTAGLASMIA
jgi:hypothetical protein